MATYNIRQRLENEVIRQSQMTQQSILSLPTSRDLLMDLSSSIQETHRTIELIQEKHQKYLSSLRQRRQSNPTPPNMLVESISTSTPSTTTSTSSSELYSLLSYIIQSYDTPEYSYLQILNYHFYRLLKYLYYTIFLIKECSLNHHETLEKQYSTYFTIEGIQKHMNENTLYYRYHCFDSNHIGTNFPSKSSIIEPNISKIKEFLSLTENYVLDMILLGWNTFSFNNSIHLQSQSLQSSQSQSQSLSLSLLDNIFSSTISSPSSSTSSASISLLLDSLINGYYNRVVSLIGICISSFQQIVSLTKKLEFIYFLIIYDTKFINSIIKTLLVMGLTLTPLPTFSLIFNFNEILTSIPSILSFEIQNFIYNSLQFQCKSSNDITLLPWTITPSSKTSLLESMLPTILYNTLQSYLQIISLNEHSKSYIPDTLQSLQSSQQHIIQTEQLNNNNDMNIINIISVECIKSYLILIVIYEKILFNVKKNITEKLNFNNLDQ